MYSEGSSVVEQDSIVTALTEIFSWRNYSIYLATAWVYTAFSTINAFFNLYLRAIGWDYALIGGVAAVTTSVAAICRLIGGYVGDVVNRKTLAVVAMAFASTYFIIIGTFTDLPMIVVALLMWALIELGKGGSSAYIMDNIPRKHSGFALSLFRAGQAFGIIVLVAFNILVPTYGFPFSFRAIAIVAGIALVICTVLRLFMLEPSRVNDRGRQKPLLRDFLSENFRAVRLLVRVIPGAILIITIDAFSDALFNFGALIYANEYLGISINGIGVMLAVTLLAGVPLLLKTGRMFDKWGVRRASLAIYSIMPVCTALLFMAPIVPTWGTSQMIAVAEGIATGLGAIFTTAFIAIILKRINDALWWLIVTAMIRRSLPQTDTSKFLAVFWFIVFVFSSIGPYVAGLIFTHLSQPFLFAVVFLLNIVILVAIARRGLYRDGIEQEAPEVLE